MRGEGGDGMKTRSIRGFVRQEQLKVSLLLIAAIFCLSTAALVVTVRVQSAGHAQENADFLQKSVERFLTPYAEQAAALNRDQSIRAYLAYAVQAEGEGAPQPPSALPGGVALYDGEKQIYPHTRAPHALPAQARTRAACVTALSDAEIGYFTPFYNFTGSDVLGYLCFVIPRVDLSRSVQQTVPETVSFRILDSQGAELCSVLQAFRYSREAVLQSDETGMTCMAAVDLESGYRSIGLFVACLVPVSLLVCGLGIWASRRMAVRMTQPINALIASIKHNERGDLGYMNLYESDLAEIEMLSQAYQALMQRLNELVDRNQKENLLRMESELDMLQEKINPHFLFNTLELISSQAILEDAEQTAVLTQKLGTLFRYTLRAPDVISLKRELQYAKDYLYLQNVRFNGKIACTYETDPTVLSTVLPKLVIQPLLENCFKHAFAAVSNTPHRIAVTIARRDGMLCIAVADDGPGMTAEAQAALEHTLRQDSENFAHFIERRDHIGLRNVSARLCLHFHVRQALWFSRSPLGGVQAEIRVPLPAETETVGGCIC